MTQDCPLPDSFGQLFTKGLLLKIACLKCTLQAVTQQENTKRAAAPGATFRSSCRVQAQSLVLNWVVVHELALNGVVA